MRVTVDISLPQDIVNKLGVGPRGYVQDFLTRRIHSHMSRYIPWKTGNTYKNLTRVTSPSEILVNAKWARYIYNGISKSGKPLNYTKNPNPMAGSHWDVTLMKHEGEAIAREVETYVKWRKKK